MHEPYEKRKGRPADFRVSYRFYTPEEGGRQTIPFQGYRSDFLYDNSDYPKPKAPTFQVFMILPEFEDTNGDIILDNTKSVNASGTARMWIINPPFRTKHASGIKVGIRGYFMEGPKKVAECTVIEILGLATDPTE